MITDPVVDLAPATVSDPDATGFRAAVSAAVGYVLGVNEAVIVVAVVADLAVTFANTGERYLFTTSIPWSQDATTVALNVLAFMGGAAALRSENTLSFNLLVDRLGGWQREGLQAVGYWLVIGVAMVTLWSFPAFFENSLKQHLPAFGISDGWASIWMGVGYALVLFYVGERLLRLSWRPALAALVAVGLVVGGIFAWQYGHVSYSVGIDPFLVVVAIVVAAFLAGAPIAFVLGAGAMAYFGSTGSLPLVAIPTAYQLGIASFLLLAIPFFMIAGTLMTITGMAGRLVEVASRWIGHWPGGLLLAQTVAMYIFSGMSGSKIADVAAVGSVMREPLRDRGYPPEESVAVLAAAGAMGETVPPAIVMVVLGSITSLSVGALFLAGVLPAVVLGIAISMGVLYRARDGRLPRGDPFQLGPAVRHIGPAIPALLVPVIIIGGIVGGVGTPTEVSSFAVVYGLLAALVAYRALSWRRLWDVFRGASAMSGLILLTLTTATLFSQAFTFDGLPAAALSIMTGFGGSAGFLILSTIGLLVLGVVLEGLPALIIFAPILVPISEKLGIDSLQFGIVLVMAMGIGSFAPPIGVGLFFASAVGGAPLAKTFGPSTFYTAMLVLGLAFVVAIPAITLVVPHFFRVH